MSRDILPQKSIPICFGFPETGLPEIEQTSHVSLKLKQLTSSYRLEQLVSSCGLKQLIPGSGLQQMISSSGAIDLYLWTDHSSLGLEQ